MCLLGSGRDKEGAFQDGPGEGHRGVQSQPAALQESQPHDRSHRQDHRGAGEGQGGAGRADGQWSHPACRVRAKILSSSELPHYFQTASKQYLKGFIPKYSISVSLGMFSVKKKKRDVLSKLSQCLEQCPSKIILAKLG